MSFRQEITRLSFPVLSPARPDSAASARLSASTSPAQALRRLGHGEVERIKAVLPDDFAGVWGIVHIHVLALLSLVVIN